MDTTGHPVEPQVDDYAARCVEQGRAGGRLAHYALVVGQVPRLLHQHGLGQTLVYLRGRAAGRSESPYQLVHDQLSAWLTQTVVPPGTDALTGLTRADSLVYMQAAESARHLVLALRRAIAAAYEPAGGQAEARGPAQAQDPAQAQTQGGD